MEKVLLLSILVTCTLTCFSQSNTMSIGSTNTGMGSVSYSVGQIDYSNQSSATGNINQGVQQPFEFYVLEINEHVHDIDLSAYPNPSNGEIFISSESLLSSPSYTIFTISGLCVEKGVMNDSHIIDLSPLPPSLYLVHILNENIPIRTFKILKQ